MVRRKSRKKTTKKPKTAKKRSSQQVEDALAKAKLSVVFHKWIVNELTNDFGFDYEIRVTDEDIQDNDLQNVSELSFYVQLKASINVDVNHPSEDLEIVDWKLFLTQKIPVVLVKYSTKTDNFFWEIVQTYVWDVLDKEDPNWKNNKYSKRIVFRSGLSDLKEVKNSIIDAQKRIIRYSVLNLGITEGIKLNSENIDNLRAHKEKYLQEFKILSLFEGHAQHKAGDIQGSLKAYSEVYESPRTDEAKIRSIFGLISLLNISDKDGNNETIRLADEGIDLAGKLSLEYLSKYFLIIKNEALYLITILNISQLLFSKKVEETQGVAIFSIIYDEEISRFNEELINIGNEIGEITNWYLQNDHLAYFAMSIPHILSILTLRIMNLAIHDQSIIEEERIHRKDFLSICETLLDIGFDKEINQLIHSDLSNYYYWNLEVEKAINHLERAIELGKENDDLHFVSSKEDLLTNIKGRPNPYFQPRVAENGNLTCGEYQNRIKQILLAQGIDVTDLGDDKRSKFIKMAFEDLNPSSILKFCENIHVWYQSTSMLGRSIGLQSLGNKIVWCEHANNNIDGFNLFGNFETFKQFNCINCDKHQKRSDDWICTTNFINEQMNNEKFKTYISNISKL